MPKLQDARLSQRDRAAGCVIVFAKSRRQELRQNFTDIIGLSSTTVIQSPENLSDSVKKRKIKAITAFKVIQGHRGRYNRKHVCDFLLVINSK